MTKQPQPHPEGKIIVVLLFEYCAMNKIIESWATCPLELVGPI